MNNSIRRRLAGLGIALLLTGCGGGGGGIALNEGGIGGTGVVVGRAQQPAAGATAVAITGSSIQVNGVTFDASGATFGGEATSLADIDTDMVVTVAGTVNAGGTTGTAQSISFSDNLQALVTSVTPTASGCDLDVMGQHVVMDTQTVRVGFSGCPASGAIIEVSGFTSGDGNIQAARVERKIAAVDVKLADEVEIKGVVQTDPGGRFMLGGLSVDYGSASLPSLGWGKGTLVEVKGTVAGFTAGSPPTLVATEVDIEDDGDTLYGQEGDLLEVEGVVTAGPDAAGLFTLNGQPVQITAQTRFANGTRADVGKDVLLEAKGTRSNGVLQAQQIEFK